MSASETAPPAGPEGAGALPAEARKIASGYAFAGPALDLGALLRDGACHPGVSVRVPLPVLNRHGLVAGATGTGKSTTVMHRLWTASRRTRG